MTIRAGPDLVLNVTDFKFSREEHEPKDSVGSFLAKRTEGLLRNSKNKVRVVLSFLLTH